MKRNERKPAAREEKEELPLGLVVAAWLAGACGIRHLCYP
jgi:hypothetical protein